MILLGGAAILVAAILAFLCVTPRGLVSPPTGFLMKTAAVLDAGHPVPFEPAARRAKSVSDNEIVGRTVRGPIAEESASAPGRGGPIPLRIYRRTDRAPVSVVILFHGGGFVVGNIGTSESFARSLCLESDAAIVSVGYRLAPESPFPAAVEDAVSAYEWVLAGIQEGRLPSGGVIASGDSAGANLAAVLCIQARNLRLPLPKAQLLFYPVADLSDFGTASYERFATGYLLTRAEMEWFRELYLPDKAAWTDPRASPLLEPDLSGLPEALVVTSAFDVLRDEGEVYAARLRAAGVAVESRRIAGVIHGFVSLSRFVPAAEVEIRRAGTFIRRRSEP
ncbi:MAG: alpha/beta hydrolase [Spirochaetes bacterium]|nr:alpha/beta hydrolase [Spirochaetota bacterium]